MDDKLLDDITLKNVILIMCFIKDDKFIPKYFLKKPRMINKHGNNMWWKSYLRKIMVSENDWVIIFERFKKSLIYVKIT